MKQQSNKIVKGLKITGSVVFYVVMGALLLFAITTMTRRKQYDIPHLFGLGYLVVKEEARSMIGDNEDSFNPGDLVLVKVLNEKAQKELDLRALADKEIVVSFADRTLGEVNTHRVERYIEESDRIVTKGDNVGEEDPFELDREDILGIYRGKIKGAGKPIEFLNTKLGFGLVILLPMGLMLLWQGAVVIRNVFAVKTDNLRAQLEIEKEEERERIKREILEEMKKEEE